MTHRILSWLPGLFAPIIHIYTLYIIQRFLFVTFLTPFTETGFLGLEYQQLAPPP